MKASDEEQVRLAQLRSGFCSSLTDYRHRIGIADSPLCRKCQNEAESVNHYLSCNYAESAELLWKDPEKAAALTRSLWGPSQQQQGIRTKRSVSRLNLSTQEHSRTKIARPGLKFERTNVFVLSDAWYGLIRGIFVCGPPRGELSFRAWNW